MDSAGSAHRSSLTEEVTSKIILTAIILVFIAVLIVLLLHLYAKLYWWRVEDNQQQSPPTLSSAIHQRRRFLFVSRQGGLSSTCGLTASDLSSLPIIVFGRDTYKDGLEMECAVCLSVLVNGDKARLLPLCSHSFHVDCIDMWLQSHSTCPICRNTVLDPQQTCFVSKQVEPDPVIASVLQSRISSSSLEPSNFPTNVLVWGSQDQISTAQEDSASNSAAPRGQGAVVLEINDSSSGANANQDVPSLPSSSMRFNNVEEEEAKSPMTTRLRSLKRFLSRDKRVACSGGSCSSAAASVEP